VKPITEIDAMVASMANGFLAIGWNSSPVPAGCDEAIREHAFVD